MTPRPGRARRGFTLIELLVSMAVAMLLLAGAFEMHAAFNRQNVRQQEVADMQQALRVATQVISRAVRTAGTGMLGGTAMYHLDGLVGRPCPVPTGNPPPRNPYLPDEICYWPVEYSNSNTYANPRTVVDGVAGDADADDDWLRILSFDPAYAVRVQPGFTSQTFPVSDVRFFNLTDAFYVSNSYPALPDGNNRPTLGWRTGCLRVPDSINPAPNPAAPLAVPGVVTLTPGPRNRNPDPCLISVTAGGLPAQSQTIQIYPVDRSVVFRIQPGAVGPPATPPELQAWYSAPLNQVMLPSSNPQFKTLTQNIEHMQVALILNDGTICGNAANSIDNSGNTPGTCNFQDVRAVRLTLVARSSSRWPGWQSQGTGGRWEDFDQPVLNDGYLRRTLTSIMEVRNDPWGAQ